MTDKPKDFRALIRLWPSYAELGRLLAEKGTLNHIMTPRAWAEKNWIPSKHWRPIVEIAKESGFEGITYAVLASFPRPPRGSHD